MQLPIVPALPLGFDPYAEIRVCGNVLRLVGVIFQIGPNVPLRVARRTADGRPTLWLSGPVGDTGNSWIDYVVANGDGPGLPGLKYLTVVQDSAQPLTVVTWGSIVVVDARDKGNGIVEISAIDLRPIGLNIYGNETDGLYFAAKRFVGNRFSQTPAAFAANIGSPPGAPTATRGFDTQSAGEIKGSGTLQPVDGGPSVAVTYSIKFTRLAAPAFRHGLPPPFSRMDGRGQISAVDGSRIAEGIYFLTTSDGQKIRMQYLAPEWYVLASLAG